MLKYSQANIGCSGSPDPRTMSCSKPARRLRRVAAELRPAATAAGLTLRIATLAPKHECLLQTSADAKLIAANLPWYSAEYSPHDVPAFYDVSGLTEQPAVFQRTIDVLAARYSGLPAERAPTAIAGFDARGFIFGPPLALALGVPFVMIRKAGKLPGVLVSSGAYETEYSTDETVMRLGSVQAGDRVVLVDDLIATGGTAIAGFELVDQLGAEVLEFAAVVCLPGLGGVEAIHGHADGKFASVPVFTLVDDATIGAENCQDPPPGTPRIMPAASAGEPPAAATAAAASAEPAAATASDSPEKIAQVLQAPTAERSEQGYAIKVGIIGGSGLDDPDILKNAVDLELQTPYGSPTSPLRCGTIEGVDCVLLARHGRDHTIQPTDVNFRANIYALKSMGCTHLVVSTAVGILTEDFKPGELALLDQYIDRTTKRPSTFYDGEPNHPPGVCHIPQGSPFCEETRQTVLGVASDLGLTMHPTATVVSIEGPRFSSRAESNFFRMLDADIINMSLVPEAPLAAEAGMAYCAIAMCTDYDSWKDDEEDVTVSKHDLLLLWFNVDHICLAESQGVSDLCCRGRRWIW